MTDLAKLKSDARTAAFARRQFAFAQNRGGLGAAYLMEYLAPHRGKIIAGYMAMRTEIDPLPVMVEIARKGSVCVPVIQGKGAPLKFKHWTPDAEMIDGPFGARVPASGAVLEPEVLIVPLVAFDRAGNRLGYGGGFYDRTLELLRSKRPTIAVGFAFAAQEAENLPLEPTDQRLDAIVTENGIVAFD